MHDERSKIEVSKSGKVDADRMTVNGVQETAGDASNKEVPRIPVSLLGNH